ncbi:hypothetical protein I4U23_018531 [Adineta vaga]|nr:hypothetical protein I4U23_018531 [Adineta vaga]
MNTNTPYTPIISANHETGESLRTFDSPYHSYSSHPMTYSEYPLSTSKSEAFEYPYWSTIPTHNILANPSNPLLDQISPSLSSNQTIGTLASVSSVHLPQNNLSAPISTTQHYHHIHQYLYPQSSTSPSPPPPPPPTTTTYNDSSAWLGSGDYQALHSTTTTTTPPSYRHYSTPCSFYPPNHFYDPSQSQWLPSSTLKFESPYSPPPSYIESSDSLNHCQEQLSKEELSHSPQQSTWLKNQSSPTHCKPVPPRNPMNGKTRTRDKYRIVYTEQQRYELENEFVLSKYISIPRKSALSLALSLSERQIKIWFQNRRAKERKLSKKRHDVSSTHQLNNSNDTDSRSDGGLESPNYYPNYT